MSRLLTGELGHWSSYQLASTNMSSCKRTAGLFLPAQPSPLPPPKFVVPLMSSCGYKHAFAFCREDGERATSHRKRGF
jgi:hypothetical protein